MENMRSDNLDSQVVSEERVKGEIASIESMERPMEANGE